MYRRCGERFRGPTPPRVVLVQKQSRSTLLGQEMEINIWLSGVHSWWEEKLSSFVYGPARMLYDNPSREIAKAGVKRIISSSPWKARVVSSLRLKRFEVFLWSNICSESSSWADLLMKKRQPLQSLKKEQSFNLFVLGRAFQRDAVRKWSILSFSDQMIWSTYLALFEMVLHFSTISVTPASFELYRILSTWTMCPSIKIKSTTILSRCTKHAFDLYFFKGNGKGTSEKRRSVGWTEKQTYILICARGRDIRYSGSILFAINYLQVNRVPIKRGKDFRASKDAKTVIYTE